MRRDVRPTWKAAICSAHEIRCWIASPKLRSQRSVLWRWPVYKWPDRQVMSRLGARGLRWALLPFRLVTRMLILPHTYPRLTLLLLLCPKGHSSKCTSRYHATLLELWRSVTSGTFTHLDRRACARPAPQHRRRLGATAKSAAAVLFIFRPRGGLFAVLPGAPGAPGAVQPADKLRTAAAQVLLVATALFSATHADTSPIAQVPTAGGVASTNAQGFGREALTPMHPDANHLGCSGGDEKLLEKEGFATSKFCSRACDIRASTLKYRFPLSCVTHAGLETKEIVCCDLC